MKNKICNILDGKYFWVFFVILGALIQMTVFLFTKDMEKFQNQKTLLCFISLKIILKIKKDLLK